MTADDVALSTTDLTKAYGESVALRNASISVPRGTIYGFLGPNGAGKTTTIRLIMGFIQPTSGHARIAGFDSWTEGLNARRDLGFLVTADALYADMSGHDQLDYAARLSKRPPVLQSRILDALELGSAALGRKLGSYSKGMRQKLALVAAMQHDPSLLILDEPTDGLDPLIQRNFEALLLSLRDQGRTIFMSSHDLAEVDRICDRVAVIRSGEIVAEERIEQLRRRHANKATVVFRGEVPTLDDIPDIAVAHRTGRQVEIAMRGDPNPLLRVLARYDVESITITAPSLEEIFMGYYETAAPQ